MSAHCTASTPTQCAPCRQDYFTALWNYLPRCLYCNNFCNGNQEVETECSATTNRVCRCQKGFYGLDDFCIPHTECGPGHGVLTKGTWQTDTVCTRCSDGYFSNSLSALDSCIKHQECANEKIELLSGSADQDTLCGTCEDLANGGETFRTFLSGFFTLHKMRVGKMKKFVARYANSTLPSFSCLFSAFHPLKLNLNPSSTTGTSQGQWRRCSSRTRPNREVLCWIRLKSGCPRLQRRS
uniref:Tumor necrosis factor receptor superfamily member 6B-like n=1 Tax=Acanthochromis polyacanthus TaxID=80966 RepID=A0A3Q1G9K8_9TELE